MLVGAHRETISQIPLQLFKSQMLHHDADFQFF